MHKYNAPVPLWGTDESSGGTVGLVATNAVFGEVNTNPGLVHDVKGDRDTRAEPLCPRRAQDHGLASDWRYIDAAYKGVSN